MRRRGADERRRHRPPNHVDNDERSNRPCRPVAVTAHALAEKKRPMSLTGRSRGAGAGGTGGWGPGPPPPLLVLVLVLAGVGAGAGAARARRRRIAHVSPSSAPSAAPPLPPPHAMVAAAAVGDVNDDDGCAVAVDRWKPMLGRMYETSFLKRGMSLLASDCIPPESSQPREHPNN